MAEEKTFPETERTLGALLRAPWQVLAERVYGALAASYPDIRPAHGAVFRYIGAEGSRIVDLAARAGMTKQSMAVLVDYLAAHRYLTVTPDPRDGRAKQVCLTRRGRAVQRKAQKLSQQIEAEWAALIGEGEMTTLRHLLERLYDRLEDL